MDEKHRQYCIKLGNPYMNLEKYQKPYENYNNMGNVWNENENQPNNNWMKDTKK